MKTKHTNKAMVQITAENNGNQSHGTCGTVSKTTCGTDPALL